MEKFDFNLDERNLSEEELELIEKNSKFVSIEIDHDINVIRKEFTYEVLDNFDINDQKSVELYNNSLTSSDRAEEFLRVTEGALARYMDLEGFDMTPIDDTISLINLNPLLYNGAQVSFIPLDTDFLITFNDKIYELGESSSYLEIFRDMAELETKYNEIRKTADSI